MGPQSLWKTSKASIISIRSQVLLNSFGSDLEFPGVTAGDDDDFAILVLYELVVPVDGNYQFGFRGDDGGYVRITGGPDGNGGNFSSILVNATGACRFRKPAIC